GDFPESRPRLRPPRDREARPAHGSERTRLKRFSRVKHIRDAGFSSAAQRYTIATRRGDAGRSVRCDAPRRRPMKYYAIYTALTVAQQLRHICDKRKLSRIGKDLVEA